MLCLAEKADFETRRRDFVLEDEDFRDCGFHGQTLYISPSTNLVVSPIATGEGYALTFARAMRRLLN